MISMCDQVPVSTHQWLAVIGFFLTQSFIEYWLGRSESVKASSLIEAAILCAVWIFNHIPRRKK